MKSLYDNPLNLLKTNKIPPTVNFRINSLK